METNEKLLKKTKRMLKLSKTWFILIIVLCLFSIFGKTIVESTTIRFLIKLILLIASLTIGIIQLVNTSKMMKEVKKKITESNKN